jgi:methionyl-tRNA formyltransferase
MKEFDEGDSPKVIFAGDRQIAVDVLRHIKNDVDIVALLLPPEETGSHSDELIRECEALAPKYIIRPEGEYPDSLISALEEKNPDLLISVHYSEILPDTVLDIPTYDAVNLHPSFLPYNRGWHTPSWAIFENTKFGATLHVMDERLDQGAIIDQIEVDIEPDDTADSLYQKAMDAELRLFARQWPFLKHGTYSTSDQHSGEGTTHAKRELEAIREIDLADRMTAEELLRKLRALSTNRWDEAAYVEIDETRYLVRVEMKPQKLDQDEA